MSLMELVRGDSRTFTLTLTEPDGSPLVLTGLDIRFTAKRSRWDVDEDAVFLFTVGDHMTVTDEDGGLVEIAFEPEDTAEFEEGVDFRSLRCDVQVAASATDVKTPWTGKLRIHPDITRTA